MSKKIEIYDTTLRDGAQMQGISLTVSDKLKIAKLLDELGVDYIEGGWPGANPKDVDFFAQAKDLNLKNSKLVAFGSTMRADSQSSAEDSILSGLLAADTEAITIVAKSWDLHVTTALKTTLERNLEIIKESIEYLKSKDKIVNLDAEHFFDGYKANTEYSKEIIKTCISANVDVITLCDTNGGSLPEEVSNIVNELTRDFPNVTFGIHTHNDCGLAVANSLAAISSGVTQIQGTINGYGERCGNADLTCVIPCLALKMGFDVLNAKENLERLTYISKAISNIANMNLSIHHPFVGRAAFGHKGGLHASAMLKDASTYQHIEPELVGNLSRILVSEQAGLSNIMDFAQNRNIDLGSDSKEIGKSILAEIKEKEYQGYQFEQASASLELLFLRKLGKCPRYYELLDFRVSSIYNNLSEATIRIKVGEDSLHTASLGVGPGHALDQALRKALSNYYPEALQQFRLNDFKVRVVDSHDGTAAKTKVDVETIDSKGQKWSTVGVNENILQASLEAISASIEYGLYKQGIKAVIEV